MAQSKKNLTTEKRRNGGKNRKCFSVSPFLRGSILALAAGVVLAGCFAAPDVLFVTPTPWATIVPAVSGAAPMQAETPIVTATPGETAPIPTATSMVQNGIYVVQPDDTLWYISAQLGVPMEVIIAANPTLDPNLLFPNDTIIIPPYDPANPDAWIATLPPTETPTLTITATATLTATPAPTLRPDDPTPTPTPSPTPTATALPSATPRPANTPGGPVPTYPYMFNITARADEIYAAGQQMGNRANVFSKVGDSITDNTVFLMPFAGTDYNLGEHTYLQPVIDYYQQGQARTDNPFGNGSLAAKGGWSVWHLFDADSADPSVCQPDEAPLACEYRVGKPSVALIMIGTNDVVTMSVPTYERYMRRVIDTSINMGVIPVISTIPEFTYEDVGTKVQQMNELIARLAYEYEIPLWDYWSAMEPLPNHGLSTDGVHPSWAVAGDLSPKYLVYGMNTRNLTALQALDVLWRGVLAK